MRAFIVIVAREGLRHESTTLWYSELRILEPSVSLRMSTNVMSFVVIDFEPVIGFLFVTTSTLAAILNADIHAKSAPHI